MDCCKKECFVIYKSFATRWNEVDWLSIKFSSDTHIDFTGFAAKFKIGSFVFENNDLYNDWIINLTDEQTATLPLGPNTASLIVYDTEGEGKPFTTSIPVLVKDWVEGDVEIDTYKATVLATLDNQNEFIVKVETAKVSLDWVDEKISEHNSSESAHPYIQGLISDEKQARINADNVLDEKINGVIGDLSNYRTAAQQDVIDNAQNTAIASKQDKLTQAQLNAVNSGITASKVSSYDSHISNNNIHVTTQDKTTWNNKQNALDQNQMAAVNSGANTTNIGQITTNKNAIGNLSSLTTTSKTNLVSAINEVDGIAGTALQPSDVVNNTSSTATNKPLSANMGKSLQDQVDNLKARGRFLALWNCATGLAESNPPSGTYTYQSGDYFIVGVVAQSGGTNYKPDGSTYTTGVASTVIETQPVDTDDVYYYDGHVWRLQVNTQKEIGFVNIAGDPYDNSNLAAAFNAKQNTITGAATTITENNLTANRALVSNAQGKVAVSPVTNTELGYLSGATSSIQTQLNGKQDTLVSGTNIKTINSTTVLGSGNFTLANQSLSNLDSTGQMVIDSQNGTISNCILEIPQDIKITLSSGTLTVKSGSKYYFPDGSQYELSADASTTLASNGTYMLFRSATGYNVTVGLNNIVSGYTDSKAGTTYHTWFDTDYRVIKRYTSDASTPETTLSLPLALITVSGGAISSIDQVFNGAGYCGHHAFVLPDVKGLWSDGKNSDGTLKSGNIADSSLKIIEMVSGQAYTGYNRTIPLLHIDNLEVVKYNWRAYKEVENISQVETSAYFRTYVKNDNAIYCGYGSGSYNRSSQDTWGTPFIEYNYNGTSVTKFDIRQPVRLATTEMLDKKQDTISDLETIRSGAAAGATAVQPATLNNYVRTNNAKFVALNVQAIDQETYPDYIDLEYIPVDKGEAEFGFAFDENYYALVSQNTGVDESYAYGKIYFSVPADTTVNIYFEQSSEQNFDFGEISNLDEELTYDNQPDDYVAWSGQEYDDISDSVSFDVSAGTHFFTFKFIKDSSASGGSDNFRITGIDILPFYQKTLVDYSTQEEITSYVKKTDIVSYLSPYNTNEQAVGAQLFYNTVGNIETLLHEINSGGQQ